jgi:hypothetical protein
VCISVDKECLQTLPPADSAAKCLAKCKHHCQRKPYTPKMRGGGGIGGQVFGEVRSSSISLGWWMFPHRIQHAPQVDEFLSIQAQGLDCGSSCGRQSDDESKIFAPCKMVAPTLSAWMIEWSKTI